jgi:flagellar biosynthesis protein FliR
MVPFTSLPQIAVLRVSFAVGLALAFGGVLPQASSVEAAAMGDSVSVPLVPFQDLSLGGILGEFLLGLFLGLPAALVVNAASMWAEIVDGVRGQTTATFFDPLTERQETGLVTLVRSLVLASILVLGLGEALVQAYARSFDVLPVGGLSLSKLQEGAMQTFRAVLGSLDVVTNAAFPLAVIGAVIEVALALVAKFLPQGGFSHESFLLKSAVLFAAALMWWRLGLEQSLFHAAQPHALGAF